MDPCSLIAPFRGQLSKWLSRIAVASVWIVSHEASGVLEMVTKSAVMKKLVTPSTARSRVASGSSVDAPATKVLGPPTGTPTENFIALGLGVGPADTGMGGEG